MQWSIGNVECTLAFIQCTGKQYISVNWDTIKYWFWVEIIDVSFFFSQNHKEHQIEWSYCFLCLHFRIKSIFAIRVYCSVCKRIWCFAWNSTQVIINFHCFDDEISLRMIRWDDDGRKCWREKWLLLNKCKVFLVLIKGS